MRSVVVFYWNKILLFCYLLNFSTGSLMCIEKSATDIEIVQNPKTSSGGTDWQNIEDAQCKGTAFSYVDLIAYQRSNILVAKKFRFYEEFQVNYPDATFKNVSLQWLSYLSDIPFTGCKEDGIYLYTTNGTFIDITKGNSMSWINDIIKREIVIDFMTLENIYQLSQEDDFGFGISVENGGTDISAYLSCMSIKICFEFLNSTTIPDTTDLNKLKIFLLRNRVYLFACIAIPIFTTMTLFFSVGICCSLIKRQHSKTTKVYLKKKEELVPQPVGHYERWEHKPYVWLTAIQISQFIKKTKHRAIYKGIMNNENEVTCKSIDMTECNTLEEDMVLLTKLKHKNVVEFCGLFCDNNSICYIVTESGESIQSLYNSSSSQTIDQKMIMQFLCNIVEGLIYLADNRIIHRNICTESIYLATKDNQYVAKIGDLETAQKLENGHDFVTGSVEHINAKYAPPESLREKKYYLSSDVWSFGNLLYAMLNNGMCPFQTQTEPELSDIYMSDETIQISSWPVYFPQELKGVVIQCLNKDHLLRPKLLEIWQALNINNPQDTMLQINL